MTREIRRNTYFLYILFKTQNEPNDINANNEIVSTKLG